jgi:hypothetical protein
MKLSHLTLTGPDKGAFNNNVDKILSFFLNSANFAQHILLSLAPPSGFTLNLKALMKV